MIVRQEALNIYRGLSLVNFINCDPFLFNTYLVLIFCKQTRIISEFFYRDIMEFLYIVKHETNDLFLVLQYKDIRFFIFC